MCEKRRGRRDRSGAAAWVLAASLAPVGASPVAAQSLDELRARAEGAIAEWRAADSAATAEREAAEAGVRVDTLAMSGFLVISDSIDEPHLRAALDAAWRHAASSLGPTDLHLADGGRVLIRIARGGMSWNHLVVAATPGSPSVTYLHEPSGPNEERFQRGIRHSIAQTIIARGGETARIWTGGYIGLEEGAALYERGFVEFATTASQAARFCLLGDDASCAQALMLIPVEDPLTELYDAGDRHVLVERHYATSVPRDLAPLFNRCTQRADDVACLEYLRRRWEGRSPRLISPRSNAALVWVAKQIGGDGALSRFSADTLAPLADRLEAAAGVPMDTLIRSWRDTLLARRPAPASARIPADWIVLVWAVTFGGLALRSSRWR